MEKARLQLVVGLTMELVLVGLVIGLIAFGNRSLSPGFTIFVDLDRLESLREGAQVRISPLVAGRVIAIRQGRLASEPPMRAKLRLQVWLRRDQAHFVRRNSVITVNAKGPASPRYLEVVAGEGEPGAAVEPGDVLRGVESPGLDRLIRRSYEAMLAARGLFDELGPETRTLGAATRSLRARVEELGGPGRLERLGVRVRQTVVDVATVWRRMRAGIGDRGQDAASVALLGDLPEETQRRLAKLSDRWRRLSQQLDALVEAFGPGDWIRGERALQRLGQGVGRASEVLRLIHALRDRLHRGRGTLGRFLTDDEIHDEIKEIHRSLKERPWRVLRRGRRGAAPSRRPGRR